MKGVLWLAWVASCVAVPVVASADDAKPIDPEHVKMVGKLLIEETAKLKGLPVAVAPDLDRAVGIEGDNRHLIAIPDAKLTADVIAAVKGTAVPAGCLYFHRATIVVAGDAVAADKHRSFEIAARNEKVTVKMMQLAVARVEGRLVLLAYADGTVPAFVTPLVDVQDASPAPIALGGRAADNKGIELVLTLSGRYKATVPLAPQD